MNEEIKTVAHDAAERLEGILSHDTYLHAMRPKQAINDLNAAWKAMLSLQSSPDQDHYKAAEKALNSAAESTKPLHRLTIDNDLKAMKEALEKHPPGTTKEVAATQKNEEFQHIPPEVMEQAKAAMRWKQQQEYKIHPPEPNKGGRFLPTPEPEKHTPHISQAIGGGKRASEILHPAYEQGAKASEGTPPSTDLHHQFPKPEKPPVKER